jgi:hypothetical protein
MVGRLLPPGRLAHPHRRVRILRTDGQVLGHSLDEPQRQPQRAGHVGADVGAGDVVLERVHQLVAEHVVGRLERAGKRQHDPPLEGLGHAARPLADPPHQRIRLPEVRAAGIQDERLPSAKLVVEELRQPRVPPLGHPGGHPGRFFFFGVVIDIEVLGRQHTELEGLVLDPVLAEITGLRQRRRVGRGQHGGRERDNANEHQGSNT